MDIYIVFVLTDAGGNIIAVNSSAFLTDVTGWTSIGSGTGDKYHHAQSNYFDKPIVTDSGVYRYRLVDGSAVEKTEAEIALEESAIPAPPLTGQDIIRQLEQANTDLHKQIQMIDGAFSDFLMNVVPFLGTGA
jgi:hypothetical protein